MEIQKKIEQVPGTQAVARALTILSQFTARRPVWSVTGLSSELKLTIPTTHRLVRVLVAYEFLVYSESDGGYVIGPGILKAAEPILAPDLTGDLYAMSMPHLIHLRDETKETTTLFRSVGPYRVALAEAESIHPVKLTLGVGRARPLYTGATGKVFLAYSGRLGEPLPDEAEDDQEVADSKSGLSDQEAAAIRANGFAISINEALAGGSAIASPIFGSQGDVVAVLSVGGPTERWTRDAMIASSNSLVEAAREISRALVDRSKR